MEEQIGLWIATHIYATITTALNIIAAIGVGITFKFVKKIFNCIRLNEYKHIALLHALDKEFSNGFQGNYAGKLAELIKEHNFKVKGE